MELYERLEQILAELRPAFRREATYDWFMVLMWGVLLCHQAPAVTSYLNGLGAKTAVFREKVNCHLDPRLSLLITARDLGQASRLLVVATRDALDIQEALIRLPQDFLLSVASSDRVPE